MSTFGVLVEGMKNVTLIIDGTLEASKHFKQWPFDSENVTINFIEARDSENFNVRGKGTVEGNGYEWWVREWAGQNGMRRPCLLQFIRVQTSEITGVTFRNSPMFSVKVQDVDSVYIHDLEIFNDIWKQRDLMKQETEQIDSFLYRMFTSILNDELKAMVE